MSAFPGITTIGTSVVGPGGHIQTVVPLSVPLTPGSETVTAGVTTGLMNPMVHAIDHQEHLKDRIRAQIEYYFSVENLTRDEFIRHKMDAQGYLPISLIASFHRVQNLTQDVAMIITALKESKSVELSENGLKARPRDNPLEWPLSTDASKDESRSQETS